MGLVVSNPDAGPSTTDRADLEAAFPGARVIECDASEVVDHVRAGVAEGVPWIAVAGGDGTLRGAAEVLRTTSIPMVPVPAGTRNHFARAVGIEDLAAAGRASAGRQVAIDLGEVNGECFLNNSSVGAYPSLVERRERHQRRVPKRVAQVLAAVEEMRHGRPVTVEIDGRRVRSWLVFVGNGRYGGTLSDLGERESLTATVLDVRVVRASGRAARLRLLGAAVIGRLGRSAALIGWTTPEVELDAVGSAAQGGAVRVALDGEVVTLRSPLRYRSIAGGLQVLLPPD